MDNAQNSDSYINIPSSQTSKPSLSILLMMTYMVSSIGALVKWVRISELKRFSRDWMFHFAKWFEVGACVRR
jgi:hypothetical protein